MESDVDQSLPLGVDEVHVWKVAIDQVEQQNIAAYQTIMSTEEMARNQRYRFEKNRFADCITRALVRTVLSKYAKLEPAAWQFEKGEHGKPELINSPIPLRFNLSHSSSYIVCAVTPKYDLGIDIENVERGNDVLAIADRYFSAKELVDLFQLSGVKDKTDRFFDYWTLKEAYMKASGEGISLGLGNFSFHFDESGAISISFGEKLDDNSSHWNFELSRPTKDHRMALAVRSGCSENSKLLIRHFDTIPVV